MLTREDSYNANRPEGTLSYSEVVEELGLPVRHFGEEAPIYWRETDLVVRVARKLGPQAAWVVAGGWIVLLGVVLLWLAWLYHA